MCTSSWLVQYARCAHHLVWFNMLNDRRLNTPVTSHIPQRGHVFPVEMKPWHITRTKFAMHSCFNREKRFWRIHKEGENATCTFTVQAQRGFLLCLLCICLGAYRVSSNFSNLAVLFVYSILFLERTGCRQISLWPRYHHIFSVFLFFFVILITLNTYPTYTRGGL